jgi:hypothetical protein
MKRLVAALFFLSLCIHSATADLMVYDFFGTVTLSNSDYITVGSEVHYFFEINFDEQAFSRIDDVRTYVNDTTLHYLRGDASVDYFYADFIGTYSLPDLMSYDDNTERNIGQSTDYLWAPNDYGVLKGGQHHHPIVLTAYATVGSWDIGQEVTGVEYSNSGGKSLRVESILKLESIRAPAPQARPISVPEPSTISMLISGLLGLGGCGLLRRKK